ncbi:MAG: hypothetical protein WAZ12_01190 [Candidatus Absconditicoccaceae bacterium]
MKDTLNELKSKINNISKINIDVVKDEIETFILTSIKNKIKQESYIKELKGISFSTSIFVMEDDYFNPGGKEQNRQAETQGFNIGRRELNNLLIKIETFLNSEINIEENNNSTPLIPAGMNIHAGGDIIIGNNNKNIINEIDDFLKLIEEKNINKKEEIKSLLEEFKDTKDKNKLVNIFSILGNGASIGSMIIALSNLIK